MSAPVLVAGAGPAGAALAYLLARNRLDVTLIERERGFDRLFRGEGMMPTGVDALRQILGEEELEELPQRRLDRWEFWIEGDLALSLPEPTRGKPDAIRVLGQPALLERLVERAGAYPGFELRTGETVRDVRSTARAMEVRVHGPDGTRVMEAQLVIGADGRNSVVRRRAELPLEDFGPRWDFVWWSFPLPAWLERETVMCQSAAGGRMLAAYPSWDGSLRLGLLIPKGSFRELRRRGSAAWIEDIAATAPPHLAEHVRSHASAASEPIPLKVMFGCVRRWTAQGVLLLGDAAHPMSPNRAQGINLALRDAIVAANQLVPVLRASDDSGRLALACREIEALRRPEIEICQQAQRRVDRPPGPLRSRLFRRAVLPGLRLARIPQRLVLRMERELRQGAAEVRLEV